MKSFLIACVCLTGLTFTALAAPDGNAKLQTANVSDVLLEYGKLTGKKILPDNTVQGQITGVASAEENADRKVELIEKALFLNGFKLVDIGDDVVAVLGLGRPVRSVGLPIYTKPEELPGGQRVFTYVFKLEHRDARVLAGLLTQYIPPDTATAFTPDPESGTLIVTGQTSVVRDIIKLVPMLDTATAPVEKAADPGKAR